MALGTQDPKQAILELKQAYYSSQFAAIEDSGKIQSNLRKELKGRVNGTVLPPQRQSEETKIPENLKNSKTFAKLDNGQQLFIIGIASTTRV